MTLACDRRPPRWPFHEEHFTSMSALEAASPETCSCLLLPACREAGMAIAFQERNA